MTKVTYKAFLGKGNTLIELENLSEVEALVVKNVFVERGFEVMVSTQYTQQDEEKEDVDPDDEGIELTLERMRRDVE
jgi:hypothetical protein